MAHGAIDAARLLDTMHAMRGRLVFAEKGRSAVEGFLVGRALMYSTVYFHKTVRAAEIMAQAALERMPGYPEDARGAFDWTDGEWLCRLRDLGGLSAELVRGLTSRSLYKRVPGHRTVTAAPRRGWMRYLERPGRTPQTGGRNRRARPCPAGFCPGRPRRAGPAGDPVADWGEIGLAEEGHVTYPFRQPSLWLLLATRPPSDWAVSVYATARSRAAVERVVSRDASFLP